MGDINWMAFAAAVVAGQVISTIWFVVLFGEPWAREYGAASKAEHAKEIPGYTYGVGLLCTAALAFSLAHLHHWLGVDSAGSALHIGLFVAFGFCVATGLPGLAFLRRWRVAAIALGSQVVMILAMSLILGVWPQT